MRFRLTFRASVANSRIPLSYNDRLSGQLASWLEVPLPTPEAAASSEECQAGLFVFSRLFIKSKVVDVKTSTIKIFSPQVSLYLGVPDGRPGLEELPARLTGREFVLGAGAETFSVGSVETVAPPAWSRRMSFRMLSPTLVAGPDGTWLRADNPGLGEILGSVLISRYRCLYGDIPQGDDEFSVQVDPAYMEQHGGGSGVAKRVHLRDANGTTREVEGFYCPVTLRGNPQLIALAYDSGLGVMGMRGFGMLG